MNNYNVDRWFNFSPLSLSAPGTNINERREIMKLWNHIARYSNSNLWKNNVKDSKKNKIEFTKNEETTLFNIKKGGEKYSNRNYTGPIFKPRDAIKKLQAILVTGSLKNVVKKKKWWKKYKKEMDAYNKRMEEKRVASLSRFYTKNGTVRRNILNNQDAITYNKVNLKHGVILITNKNGPARIYSKNTYNKLMSTTKKDPQTREKITDKINIPNDIKKAIEEQRKELINKIAKRTTYKSADLKNMSIPDLTNIPLPLSTFKTLKRATVLTNLLNNYTGKQYKFKPNRGIIMNRNNLNYYIASHINLNKIDVIKNNKKFKTLKREGNTWSNNNAVAKRTKEFNKGLKALNLKRKVEKQLLKNGTSQYNPGELNQLIKNMKTLKNQNVMSADLEWKLMNQHPNKINRFHKNNKILTNELVNYWKLAVQDVKAKANKNKKTTPVNKI